LRSIVSSVATPNWFTERATPKFTPGGTTTDTRTQPSLGAICGPNSFSPTRTVTAAPGSVWKAGLAAARSRTTVYPRTIDSPPTSATTSAACGKRSAGKT
jgi:hypothetical protein